MRIIPSQRSSCSPRRHEGREVLRKQRFAVFAVFVVDPENDHRLRAALLRSALSAVLIAVALTGAGSGPRPPRSAVAPTNDAPNPYQTIEGWAKMPAGRAWGSTSAVDIDKDGRSIWVAERCGRLPNGNAANRCAVSDGRGLAARSRDEVRRVRQDGPELRRRTDRVAAWHSRGRATATSGSPTGWTTFRRVAAARRPTPRCLPRPPSRSGTR